MECKYQVWEEMRIDDEFIYHPVSNFVSFEEARQIAEAMSLMWPKRRYDISWQEQEGV